MIRGVGSPDHRHTFVGTQGRTAYYFGCSKLRTRATILIYLWRWSVVAPSLYLGSARDLFRAMSDAGGSPLVDPGHLGVRTGGARRDIEVDSSGSVHPDTGGMSVTPDDPMDLPRHRRPRGRLGTGTGAVWSVASPAMAGRLAIRQDRPTHWLIEPSSSMELSVFEEALADTAPRWRLSNV